MFQVALTECHMIKEKGMKLFFASFEPRIAQLRSAAVVDRWVMKNNSFKIKNCKSAK